MSKYKKDYSKGVRAGSTFVEPQTKSKFDQVAQEKGLKIGYLLTQFYELIANDEEFRKVFLEKIFPATRQDS